MRARHERPARRLLTLVVLAVATEVGAAVDLAGKWYREGFGITTIAQSGDVVTIDGFSGTVTAPGLFTVSASIGACSAEGRLRLLPGASVIDGNRWVYCGPPGPPSPAGRLLLTRCQCDDGNATNGDGCDGRCQVEPCFTCSGDPASCTPLGDGAACTDGRDCTSGETCTGGLCAGGTAVPACVDVSGYWRIAETVEFVGFTEHREGFLVQKDGIVELRDFFSVYDVGTIDTATGALQLQRPSESFPCSFDGFSVVVGTSGFSGTGVVGAPGGGGFGCTPFGTTVVGRRCGGGTIDPAETCDDGNGVGGDGCSATCQIESCWSCTGDPSVCTPADGTPCNDGNVCTTGDACSGGTCAAGAPVDCGACFACTPPAGCRPAPRSDCRTALKPEKGSLQIVDRDANAKDLVRWKWVTGAATSLADLGDPTTASDVSLCVFDESGAVPAVAFRATAPAGGTCGNRSCWRAKGGGYGFTNNAASGDGLTGVSLKSGAAGKARMLLKGKGDALGGHAFGLPAPPLSLPLRVQLQVDGGACFETRHDATSVQQNAQGAFKARGTP